MSLVAAFFMGIAWAAWAVRFISRNAQPDTDCWLWGAKFRIPPR